MAYWNGLRIVEFEPEPYPGYPGWLRIDCGCCGGLKWGTVEPQDCTDCGGSGQKAMHETTKAVADYPGGPFRGRR